MTDYAGRTSIGTNQNSTQNNTTRTILVSTANPNGSQLRLDKELKGIQAALQRAGLRDQFEVKYAPASSFSDLREAMFNYRPQIVHFAGHGIGQPAEATPPSETARQFVPVGRPEAFEAGLILEDETGEVQLVSTEALAALFKHFANSVECVVLNACYSEQQAEAISQHIPYVIGMKQAIRDQAAIKFAISFYNALGWGMSFESAYELGRNALQPENIPEHLTPVIKHKDQPDPLQQYYTTVINAIGDGDIVPFLGPEINLCDRQPDRSPRTPDLWDINSDYPPSQDELAAYLDKARGHLYLNEGQCPLCDPNHKDLPKECPFLTQQAKRMPLGSVSQLIDVREGSGALETFLSQVSSQNYTPNSVHRFFAALPQLMEAKKYPKTNKEDTLFLIVTANFDSTLEHAFIEAKQSFDLVSYVQDEKGSGFTYQRFSKEGSDDIVPLEAARRIDEPGKSSNLFSKNYPIILKLYGSATWDSDNSTSFAITEDHYIDYLAHAEISEQFPAPLLNKLRRSHIWFLGYSLNYWNHRVILHRIWRNQKPKKKWWVVPEPTHDLEQKLWSSTADCIDCPLEKFIKELDMRLKAKPS